MFAHLTTRDSYFILFGLIGSHRWQGQQLYVKLAPAIQNELKRLLRVSRQWSGR